MIDLQDTARLLLVGCGATVVLDAWLLVLGRMGVPGTNFAFLGRWVGHMSRGKFVHDAIGRAPPIRGELALGWIAHYAIGIGFAALLLVWQGEAWARQPTPWPALAVGVATVLAPLLVMQPAMGAGVASSRTATPARNVFRSLANHTVFGLGLFVSSVLAAWLLR